MTKFPAYGAYSESDGAPQAPAVAAKTVPQFIHAYVESSASKILKPAAVEGARQDFQVRFEVMRPYKPHFDHPEDGFEAVFWPHGGPTIVFDTFETTDDGKAVWGVWREYGAAYPERAKAFSEDRSNLSALADRPGRHGVFYSPDHVDEATLDAALRENDIRAVPIEHFVSKILSYPAFVKGGPNFAFEDKLIVAGELNENLRALATRETNSRKAGSETLFFCDCEKRESCFHPRIVVQKFGEGRTFRLSSRDGSKRLRFLDIDQLAYALDEDIGFIVPELSLTARNVREAFRYVDRTYGKWTDLRKKWRSYDLSVYPERMFSGASLAKAWLNRCGVQPFRERNPEIDAATLSKFRAAFHGPRFEARIVGHAVRVIYCDFTSQYPAVSSLLGLQRFITAEKISVVRDRSLPPIFDNLTLEDLFEPAAWRHLNGVALVAPDNDVLPITTDDGLSVETIMKALPYWVTFADVAASRILTGRTPKVLETLELIAEGLQDGISNHPFPANVPVDWQRKDKDIFVQLVEAKKSGAPISKPAINSLAFGLFGQINETAGSFQGRIDIWYAGICRRRATNKDGDHNVLFAAEKPSEFNAPWGALITGGGRLMLAMAEALCRKHGLTYAMTNTDAVGFVYPEDEAAIQAGQTVTFKSGRSKYAEFARKVNEIRAAFQRLSPFDQKIDFFKIEYPSRDSKMPVYMYQIRTGRYVLFTWTASRIVIHKIAEGGAHNLPDEELDLPKIDGVEATRDVRENDRPILIWAWSVFLREAVLKRKSLKADRPRLDDDWMTRYSRYQDVFLRFERVIEKTAILQIDIDGEGETIARRLIDYFLHAPGIDERQAVIVNRRFLSFKERYNKEDLDEPVFEIKGNRIVRNKDFKFAKFKEVNIAVEEGKEPDEPQAAPEIAELESEIAEYRPPSPEPELSPTQDFMRQLDFLMSVRGALSLDHGMDAANKEIERFLDTGESELVQEAGSGFVPMPHIVSRAERQETERKREREKKRAARAKKWLKSPEQIAKDRERERLKKRAARAKKGPKSPEQISKDRERERLKKRAWLAKRTPEQIANDREKARKRMRAHRAMRAPEQIEQARQRDRERKRAARANLKSISRNPA